MGALDFFFSLINEGWTETYGCSKEGQRNLCSGLKIHFYFAVSVTWTHFSWSKEIRKEADLETMPCH